MLLDAADMHDSIRAGKQVLNLDSEVRQDAGDAARSEPIGGHLGGGSGVPERQRVVSNGRLVRDHMRLSAVTPQQPITQSRERLVDILVHLVQRLEKLVDGQPL